MPLPDGRILHFVEFDRIHQGRKSLSVCGEWVRESEISPEPTCEYCRQELAITSEQMFGTESPGTPVHSTLSDPLKSYRPKER